MDAATLATAERAPAPQPRASARPGREADDARSFDERLDAATSQSAKPQRSAAPADQAARSELRARSSDQNNEGAEPEVPDTAAPPDATLALVATQAPTLPAVPLNPVNTDLQAAPAQDNAGAGAAPILASPDLPAPVAAPLASAPTAGQAGLAPPPPATAGAAPTAASAPPAGAPAPPPSSQAQNAAAALAPAVPAPQPKTAQAIDATHASDDAVLETAPDAPLEKTLRHAQADQASPRSAGEQAPAPTASPREGAPQLQASAPAPQQSSDLAQASPPPGSIAATSAQSLAPGAPPDQVHGAAARAAPVAFQASQEIIRRFNGANTRFELRLDPPELGRIDVRMEVSRDHRITAVIAADTPQALAELTRHARDLEAALQSAGLELSENGLSFDLADRGQEFADTETSRADETASLDEAGMAPAIARARPFGLDAWRGARLDIMA